MLKGKRRAKIVERKLGREKALGQWWEESNLIEIDPRTSAKDYLDSCVHELLHSALPQLSESQVIRVTTIITNGVWGQDFRRIMK